MTSECYMHEGLHIFEEHCVLQICKDGVPLPDGELGQVVTTDLNNFSFPFIRYQLGDMSYIKKERCSCGRKTKLLGEVMGRPGRLIYSKDGIPVAPTILLLLLWKDLNTDLSENKILYNKIDKFQVYQDKHGDIFVRLKLHNSNENKSQFNYIIDNYKKAFEGSKVFLDFPNKIDPLPSGKVDFVISDFEKQ